MKKTFYYRFYDYDKKQLLIGYVPASDREDAFLVVKRKLTLDNEIKDSDVNWGNFLELTMVNNNWENFVEPTINKL